MSTIAQHTREITGGVDTHKDTHTAAAVDSAGRVLGFEQFAAAGAGYRRLLVWLRSFGVLVLVGVEGTKGYGAGLPRYLREQDMDVVEIDRPDRKAHRWQGKSDPVDAEAAARAALAARRTGIPKQGDGRVEALRNLRVARRSAVHQRADISRQMKTLVITAPEELRSVLRGLGDRQLIATCAASRPDPGRAGDPAVAVRLTLRTLARRHQRLTQEIEELDGIMSPLAARIAPALLALNGVGPDVAGQLLVTAGENPERLRSEAAFAMLCGVAAAGFLRPRPPPPPQPGRRPASQLRALPHLALPSALDQRTKECMRSGVPGTACPRRRSSAASGDTSPGRSTRS
jgi:transposase